MRSFTAMEIVIAIVILGLAAAGSAAAEVHRDGYHRVPTKIWPQH
jgi:hypothetical protein